MRFPPVLPSTPQPTRDPVPSAEFEFEKYALSLEQLKDLIYEEILLYHFEDFRKKYFRRVTNEENPYKEVINNENALKVILSFYLKNLILSIAWRSGIRL